MTALIRTDDDAEAGAATSAAPNAGPITGTAAEVMVRRPKTWPASLTVAQARAAFADDHVHMLLLVAGDRLVGTLLRDDLTAAGDGPALAVARLDGRTVAASADAEAVRQELIATGRRRLAVVTADGALLGLVCLKRSRTGFCSDEGVAARAAGRADPC